MYVREYQERPKNFITCFLKFKSIRSVCEAIVYVTIRMGLMEEARGKADFSEWCGKLELGEKDKGVLNNILVLIYAIKNDI